MKIIAFGHEKNVGKDQCRKFLISYLRLHADMKNKNIVSCSFAWKLKQICYELFAWAGLHSPEFYEFGDHYRLKDVILPLINMTPRQIWIKVGNKMRDVYGLVWAKYLLESIKTNNIDVAIISDLRFPNEGNLILEENGILARVLRPSIPHTSDEADDALIGYTKWTCDVLNDGSLNDLYRTMIEFAETYIIPCFKK